MTIRRPVVAGQFYPLGKSKIYNSLERLTSKVSEKIKAIGVVSPHAGYVYSGQVAGELFSCIDIPQTVVILGPNHTGLGRPYAIITEGSWLTPLGEVKIDSELAKEIKSTCKIIEEDSSAHSREHSIEVQLPFLQFFRPDVKIVPISIGGMEFQKIGEAVANSIKKSKKDVLIVASSDMSHYEPHETAQEKDKTAIEAIIKLNEIEMLQKVSEYGISMCGYGPTAIMLVAAKILGAKRAQLVKYMTSGDVSGDFSSVVGYAGLVIF